MKKTFLLSFLSFVYYLTIHAQVVYVDCNIGDDKNSGTKGSPVFSINKAVEIINRKDNDIYVMKINPGIYILDKHVSVATEKSMTNKRIVIEANVLPDDSTWTPEKMPVIISTSKKRELFDAEADSFIKEKAITSFYINESHVTIRGIKFPGYNYPVNIYYPICRLNKAKTDLLVEQCMFLADLQTSVIQVGIFAYGDEVKVDHCIFHNANNGVVFSLDSGNGIKTGNSMTNCIVYGAIEGAIWTIAPDKDFIFKNNIITNCKYFWLKAPTSHTTYTIDSCVIVNNQNFKWDGETDKFPMNENNIIKEGNISLRMINTIWEPWPIDHLHIIPDSPGYNLRAGLFKLRKQ
jgi:hypothetical protein